LLVGFNHGTLVTAFSSRNVSFAIFLSVEGLYTIFKSRLLLPPLFVHI
jgi:hypothetical protein